MLLVGSYKVYSVVVFFWDFVDSLAVLTDAGDIVVWFVEY